MVLVNDVQSRLNEVMVREVIRPSDIGEAAAIIREAASNHRQISIAGSRHAMGGQQFGSGTTCIDTLGLDRVINLNLVDSTVEVEAGITWTSLVSWLQANQDENEDMLTIIQKQTGADELTIGGAVSSNVHGRGLIYQPIVQDIEAFTLIDPRGQIIRCDRAENRELFNLVVGGYGLAGLIATVTLRLGRRQKLVRDVQVADIDEVIPALEKRIDEGHLYGDFQYMTDESSDDFLRKGILSSYYPVGFSTPMLQDNVGLSQENWMNLYYLAHTDKKQAYELYLKHYTETSGQVYWSDNHQFSPYISNAGDLLHEKLKAETFGSLMITELYVPRHFFTAFMESVRRNLSMLRANVVYGTVRLVKKEEETVLRWAVDDYACIIFNLRVIHTDKGIAQAQGQFRMLIDQALSFGGRYYLTYHRWARKDQVLSAYPQMTTFLEQKLDVDPDEIFQSDWYRHYRALLG